MDNEFNTIFTILILGCGIYALVQAITLYRTGRIPDNSIILSRDRPLSKCLDPEGFLTYMKPRFLIFSISIIVSSAITLLNELTGFLDSLVAGLSNTAQIAIILAVSVGLPLAILIWFAVCLVKAQKNLW